MPDEAWGPYFVQRLFHRQYGLRFIFQPFDLIAVGYEDDPAVGHGDCKSFSLGRIICPLNKRLRIDKHAQCSQQPSQRRGICCDGDVGLGIEVSASYWRVRDGTDRSYRGFPPKIPEDGRGQPGQEQVGGIVPMPAPARRGSDEVGGGLNRNRLLGDQWVQHG